ncbi:MAG: hypothetical protein A3I77_06325 [Gammaproteobacteria bacterium RIFCSPLOWO2_02_FULL_42_14]|nr:MAG: hypothetical protein A3B71_06920 [Gammaproteobacteria bacterium RIFCSPHIGHO2_02_FULL_42_43]OGT52611.1 MAG: hypothetical protein A3E54_06520 [Gammaproteobacteria bacterium RIFCSPHIGHO2_12_FULL_41_25]OGT63209.1 MAG: hypothetical protein A3I77_06325 [Gammaproteobacteria bacterium RIFCSPLOWO2_02_FULL_42_14]OGT86710.1 MAG: hypothetical protein A3G86_05150 [Gammaproteobacteria bacterium RIFCSPLOWO2_12_FULL_42_18]
MDELTTLLLQHQLLDEKMLQKIKQNMSYHEQDLFSHVMQYHLVNAENLLSAAASHYHTEKFYFSAVNAPAFDLLPADIVDQQLMVPVEKKENTVTIAIANPNLFSLHKKISFQTGCNIRFVFSRYDVLYRLHNTYLSQKIYHQKLTAKIVTHQLLSDAIHRHASDIHLEPYQHDYRVRFRIDGWLHEILRLPLLENETITSCIKVLAQMDIAIKRMPQDGRLTFRSYLGFVKDCRVSSCPTLHGEKMVIRLLDANAQSKKIDQLGLTAEDQKILLKTIASPQGLILVTGPTGSGKSITLYTLLEILNKTHRNIVTIEEPVEMQIDGINQTPIRATTSFRFQEALRALLRQDPDVIMIGEIRDQETAEMALRAAQTGHLVLSTLHTNNAAETITRLCQMGIAPFHLSSALTLVIAQRLVRCLCSFCKKTNGKYNEACGCAQCNRGYSGRTGVFELLLISPEIKTNIAENKKIIFKALWKNALKKVRAGITSLDEIYRVVPSE